MRNRRDVVVGGLVAVVVVAVGVAAVSAIRWRRLPPSAPGVELSGSTPVASPTPATTPVPPSASTTTPTVSPLATIARPAFESSTADRTDAPLRIDWIGGSDVAWESVSLPNAFAVRVASIDGRPLEIRTRIRQAVMAPGATEMVDEAVAAGTDVIVMSINFVWLHWDEVACNEMTVMHVKYECLLSPISAEISRQRGAELQELIDAAVAAGVPLYVYSQPHSSDVLANPAIVGLIERAEADLAAYDPHKAHVRFVARVFTRDIEPLSEGVDFIDMVHPTPAGAERLADWLANDISAFWASTGLGR